MPQLRVTSKNSGLPAPEYALEHAAQFRVEVTQLGHFARTMTIGRISDEQTGGTGGTLAGVELAVGKVRHL